MATATDFQSLTLPEMEAIVARFEERLNAAQRAGPPSKDWVKKAIHRQGTGRCPTRLKRLSVDLILRYGDALADLFCEYPDDVVGVVPYDMAIGYQPPGRSPRINPVEVLARDAEWDDEWGVRWGHALGGVGATPVDYPLKDWSALEDYLAHHVPNPRTPGRLDAAEAVLKAYSSTHYCYGVIHLALFERLHAVRGMTEVFTDFYAHEAQLRRLLEAITAYLVELIRWWGELGANAVYLTDDWGSQTALMISPVMWRKFFKRHYAAAFAEAHSLGMDVIFHSCGHVMQIVGDLIDIGMDVLDPIQPGAMDVEELIRCFGGKVSFFGGVDLQQLLCRGSPQQVKDGVRTLVDALGRPFGGGFIIAPANVMTPEVPLENLQALFEAAHQQ